MIVYAFSNKAQRIIKTNCLLLLFILVSVWKNIMGSDVENTMVKKRIRFYVLQKTMTRSHKIMTLPNSKNERSRTSFSFKSYRVGRFLQHVSFLNQRTQGVEGKVTMFKPSPSDWGLRVADQSRDKYSSAVSQAEKQKTNNLKGGHGHGRSSCTPPGKPACSSSSLKCLYTNACSMGSKQEE